MELMKILKNHTIITIMKSSEFRMSYENHGHLIILVENNENQENPKSSTREY